MVLIVMDKPLAPVMTSREKRLWRAEQLRQLLILQGKLQARKE